MCCSGCCPKSSPSPCSRPPAALCGHLEKPLTWEQLHQTWGSRSCLKGEGSFQRAVTNVQSKSSTHLCLSMPDWYLQKQHRPTRWTVDIKNTTVHNGAKALSNAKLFTEAKTSASELCTTQLIIQRAKICDTSRY